VDTSKTITHLSLCSGYEGIGLGLRRVLPNLREIAYVEIEAFPIANLVAKMEAQHLDQAPIFTDLKTFPYEQFRGKVDILSGGFPCQPFSAAGKRKATDDPRHLFPFIADGIRKCEPRIVFLENVQGILSCKTGDGEPVLQYVLRELEQMGYRATAGIFSAEEVGAPHQRKRVFIFGYASSNGYEDRCTDAVREKRKSQEGRMQEPQRGSNATSELANNDSQVRGRSSSKQPVEIEVKEATRGSSIGDGSNERNPELANSESEGLEGYQCYSSSQQSEPIQADPWSASCTHWPSRPSEQQYEWEEPRVVGNTKDITSNVSQDNRELGQSRKRKSRGAKRQKISRQQTESQLGGATDGTTCRVDAITNRVDRLRLLGNGVVNQTAAKAFVTLIQRLT